MAGEVLSFDSKKEMVLVGLISFTILIVGIINLIASVLFITLLLEGYPLEFYHIISFVLSVAFCVFVVYSAIMSKMDCA